VTAPHLSLAGRRALVTGAGGGIGSATARLLREVGASVFAVDLPGRPVPEGAAGLECDLADPAQVAALAQGLGEEPLHVLVHCAGLVRDGVLWKLSDDDWRRVLAANLDSAFYLLRALAGRLREAGGSVVLVSSINGERGKRGQANYAASKAGLLALARTAARELGRSGVRVNCVAPGWIETAMTAAAPVAARAAALEETVLGRLGSPEDVAGAVLFLCSDLSRHVTGQVLRVDGGQLMA
jgi:acetoacetyl-CoA reductase/3-oxoacyl-[acyl-carrier protein] reductase